MSKLLTRIVACLLVPCLIADPAFAAIHSNPRPFLDAFSEQAMAERPLEIGIDRPPATEDLNRTIGAGSVRKDTLPLSESGADRSIEGTPAKKFLLVLGLADAAKLSANISTERRPDGSARVRITIPDGASSDLTHGLGLLPHELAESVSDFDLLYNSEKLLIGIFPVFSDRHLSEKLRPLYFDLSAYYFKMPHFGDAKAAEQWEAYATTWAGDQRIIQQFLKEAHHRMEPAGSGAGFYYAEAKPATGHLHLDRVPFDGPNPFLSNPNDPEAKRILFPVLPTVFLPKLSTDRHYDLSLWGQSDDKTGKPKPDGLKEGDKIWVIGPGSGFDTWLASLVVQREIHVSGINPFEIANTELFAELAGFKVKTRVFDNIADAQGHCAFGRQAFDWVLWNMPHLTDDNPRRRFGDRHDGDPEGLILQRFMWYLPDIPGPTLRARIWNAAEDENGSDMVNVILRMGQASGLEGWVESINGTNAVYTLEKNDTPRSLPTRIGTTFKPFWPSDSPPIDTKRTSSTAPKESKHPGGGSGRVKPATGAGFSAPANITLPPIDDIRFEAVRHLEFDAFLRTRGHEEVDLAPLLKAVLALDPGFKTALSDFEISHAIRGTIDHLAIEIEWQLLIPAGELLSTRLVAKDELILEEIRFDVNTLRPEPYLTSTIFVGPANALGRPPWRGASPGPMALTFPHAIERGGRKEFSQINENKSEPIWLVQHFHELLDHLLSKEDPAGDYVRLLVSPAAEQEERRHAQSFRYTELRMGEALRVSRNHQAFVADEVLRDSSQIRERFWKPSPTMLDDFKAIPIYELEAKLGGLMAEMDRLLGEGHAELAYAAFLHFINTVNAAGNSLMNPDLPGGEQRRYYVLWAQLFLVSLRIALRLPEGMQPGPEHETLFFGTFAERVRDAEGPAVAARAARELIQEIYEMHFWTDAERAERLTHPRAEGPISSILLLDPTRPLTPDYRQNILRLDSLYMAARPANTNDAIAGMATGWLGRLFLYGWLRRKGVELKTIQLKYAPVIETFVFQGLLIGGPMIVGALLGGMGWFLGVGPAAIIVSSQIYGSKLVHKKVFHGEDEEPRLATSDELNTLVGRGEKEGLRFFGVTSIATVSIWWPLVHIVLPLFQEGAGDPLHSLFVHNVGIVALSTVGILAGLQYAFDYHYETSRMGRNNGGVIGMSPPPSDSPGAGIIVDEKEIASRILDAFKSLYNDRPYEDTTGQKVSKKTYLSWKQITEFFLAHPDVEEQCRVYYRRKDDAVHLNALRRLEEQGSVSYEKIARIKSWKGGPELTGAITQFLIRHPKKSKSPATGKKDPANLMLSVIGFLLQFGADSGRTIIEIGIITGLVMLAGLIVLTLNRSETWKFTIFPILKSKRFWLLFAAGSISASVCVPFILGQQVSLHLYFLLFPIAGAVIRITTFKMFEWVILNRWWPDHTDNPRVSRLHLSAGNEQVFIEDMLFLAGGSIESRVLGSAALEWVISFIQPKDVNQVARVLVDNAIYKSRSPQLNMRAELSLDALMKNNPLSSFESQLFRYLARVHSLPFGPSQFTQMLRENQLPPAIERAFWNSFRRLFVKHSRIYGLDIPLGIYRDFITRLRQLADQNLSLPDYAQEVAAFLPKLSDHTNPDVYRSWKADLQKMGLTVPDEKDKPLSEPAKQEVWKMPNFSENPALRQNPALVRELAGFYIKSALADLPIRFQGQSPPVVKEPDIPSFSRWRKQLDTDGKSYQRNEVPSGTYLGPLTALVSHWISPEEEAQNAYEGLFAIMIFAPNPSQLFSQPMQKPNTMARAIDRLYHELEAEVRGPYLYHESFDSHFPGTTRWEILNLLVHDPRTFPATYKMNQIAPNPINRAS